MAALSTNLEVGSKETNGTYLCANVVFEAVSLIFQQNLGFLKFLQALWGIGFNEDICIVTVIPVIYIHLTYHNPVLKQQAANSTVSLPR